MNTTQPTVDADSTDKAKREQQSIKEAVNRRLAIWQQAEERAASAPMGKWVKRWRALVEGWKDGWNGFKPLPLLDK